MNVPDDLVDAQLSKRVIKHYPKQVFIKPTRLETGYVGADAGPGKALINYPAE